MTGKHIELAEAHGLSIKAHRDDGLPFSWFDSGCNEGGRGGAIGDFDHLPVDLRLAALSVHMEVICNRGPFWTPNTSMCP